MLFGKMYIIILSFLFQVLIQSQQPSYELRHNQFESIFLSAITYGSQFSPEVLQVRYKYCCLWHKYPVTQYSVTQYPVTQYSVTQYPVTQVPGDAELCDAVPGDTLSSNAVPGDTVPGDTVPGDTTRWYACICDAFTYTKQVFDWFRSPNPNKNHNSIVFNSAPTIMFSLVS